MTWNASMPREGDFGSIIGPDGRVNEEGLLADRRASPGDLDSMRGMLGRLGFQWHESHLNGRTHIKVVTKAPPGYEFLIMEFDADGSVALLEVEYG